MIPENPDREELADWAALHVAGALDATESAAFARRLESDPALRAEIERMRPVADALARSAPAVPPRAEVFARILARVRSEATAGPAFSSAPVAPPHEDARPGVAPARDGARPWRNWQADGAATTYVDASKSCFEPTAFEGVSVRRLFVDPEHDRVTMLVHMDPGTRYPSHRHGGPEECYVISGDLRVGDDLVMREGDFQRKDSGSVHEVQATERGCLLLIVSSLRDELLENSL